MNTSWKNRKKNTFPIVLVFGPTAVGKTSLLNNLFKEDYEIINADSMQVYKDLSIGTAKPTNQELKEIPHHLVNILNIEDSFDLGFFIKECERIIPEIVKRGRIPVISGGTAFYFKHYLYGMPKAPKSNIKIREEVKKEIDTKGIKVLYNELLNVDPERASKISENDSYRIARAIEVYRATGKPLSFFTLKEKIRTDIDPLLIGLERDRSELYERINKRVDNMFAQGLEEEIDTLISLGASKNTPAMKGIGYKEFFENKDIEDIKRLIKRNSRRYAKRQITFFKKLSNVNWVDPEDNIKINQLIKDFIS